MILANNAVCAVFWSDVGYADCPMLQSSLRNRALCVHHMQSCNEAVLQLHKSTPD